MYQAFWVLYILAKAEKQSIEIFLPYHYFDSLILYPIFEDIEKEKMRQYYLYLTYNIILAKYSPCTPENLLTKTVFDVATFYSRFFWLFQ